MAQYRPANRESAKALSTSSSTQPTVSRTKSTIITTASVIGKLKDRRSDTVDFPRCHVKIANFENSITS
jgi:hypothetical protein